MTFLNHRLWESVKLTLLDSEFRPGSIRVGDDPETEVVSSVERIQSAVLTMRRFVSAPEMLRAEFLKSKGWAAVPVESAVILIPRMCFAWFLRWALWV
jgi:hypothetical protein